MTIDFANGFYFHREGAGLLMGVSFPEEPGFKLDYTDAWLPELAEAIERRAPRLAEVGVRGGWAGLYENSPDHNALIGEADGPRPLPVRDRLLRPRLPAGAGGRRGSCATSTWAASRSWTSRRSPPTASTAGQSGPEKNII